MKELKYCEARDDDEVNDDDDDDDEKEIDESNNILWNDENFIRVINFRKENNNNYTTNTKYTTNNNNLYFINDDSYSSCPSTELNFNDNLMLRQRDNSVNHRHEPSDKKQPLLVEKRNARERYRVRAVNDAFLKLRQIVPTISLRNKRVSKLKIIIFSISYIKELTKLLNLQNIQSYNNRKYQ